MNEKSVKKLQNARKKESTSTLSAAVKNYLDIMGGKGDLASTAKANNIDISKADVALLSEYHGKKKELVSMCAGMLSRIDTTYITYKLLSRTYVDPSNGDNFSRENDWILENAVSGKCHKSFGNCEPIDISSSDGYVYNIVERDGCKSVYVACKLTSYSYGLVCRALLAYIKSDLEKK